MACRCGCAADDRQRAIDAAVAEEREACAKIIDEEISANTKEEDNTEARRYRVCLRMIAISIRARGAIC